MTHTTYFRNILGLAFNLSSFFSWQLAYPIHKFVIISLLASIMHHNKSISLDLHWSQGKPFWTRKIKICQKLNLSHSWNARYTQLSTTLLGWDTPTSNTSNFSNPSSKSVHAMKLNTIHANSPALLQSTALNILWYCPGSSQEGGKIICFPVQQLQGRKNYETTISL